MAKKDKNKAVETADLVAAAEAIPAKAMAAFDEVVEHLNKQPLAGPTEPAGEVSEVPATDPAKIAEAAQQASNDVQEAVAGVADSPQESPVPAETTGAPGSDLALTDDMRAPLAVPKIVKDKKPPFDWKSKVLVPLGRFRDHAIIFTIKRILQPATAIVKTFFEAVFLLIVISIWATLNLIPAAFYLGGWATRYLYNAAKMGWSHQGISMVSLQEHIKKYSHKEELSHQPQAAETNVSPIKQAA